MTSVNSRKAELRELLRNRLRALSGESRLRQSRAALDLLVQQPAWQSANRILFYAALAQELDLSPAFREASLAGKEIALPVFDATQNTYSIRLVNDPVTDCAPGRFGILEPKTHCPVVEGTTLDLILVPGLGFDKHGGRLGRGKGFYDQLLQQCSGMRCGCAFEEQIVPEIPMEQHDIPMHCLLTPDSWIVCSRQAAPLK